eukprot:gnl/TRDRNA2_/TRDRNA2_56015_c0_seq1.p3 gnl/TRDRNA2_/TRDRNA2_56015_c0~~gnl/TRDRNA2_/TRDRNA2_56015_c0_seq1.p3  ORF type:complete len:138 (-),score=22.19 gnl/TRDRNA2_/TRDRNA2_56015_c0_seq1:105-518(-)
MAAEAIGACTPKAEDAEVAVELQTRNELRKQDIGPRFPVVVVSGGTALEPLPPPPPCLPGTAGISFFFAATFGGVGSGMGSGTQGEWQALGQVLGGGLGAYVGVTMHDDGVRVTPRRLCICLAGAIAGTSWSSCQPF